MEIFPRRTEPELKVGVLRSGRRFKSGKRRKTEGADGILVCLKEVNTNFGCAKTKGLAMKRRTISGSQKDLEWFIAAMLPHI